LILINKEKNIKDAQEKLGMGHKWDRHTRNIKDK